jgi:hypothetical protein
LVGTCNGSDGDARMVRIFPFDFSKAFAPCTYRRRFYVISWIYYYKLGLGHCLFDKQTPTSCCWWNKNRVFTNKSWGPPRDSIGDNLVDILKWKHIMYLIKGKWQYIFLFSHLKEHLKPYIKLFYRFFISFLLLQIF